MKGVNFTRLKMWGEDRWFAFKMMWKKPTPYKMAGVVVIASCLVIIGTFGVWQLQRLISPELGLRIGSDSRVQLKSTLRDQSGMPLPVSVNASSEPGFTVTNSERVEVTFQGSEYKLPRIQGELLFASR